MVQKDPNRNEWKMPLNIVFYRLVERFLNHLSTNQKDIGTLYFIFGAIARVMGTCFSVLIRMEIARPDNQILAFFPLRSNKNCTRSEFFWVPIQDHCKSSLGGYRTVG